VDGCLLPAHVGVATGTASPSSEVAGQRLKVLGSWPNCEFLQQISLKCFSKVDNWNMWQDMETVNHWRLNLARSLMDVIIDWTGLDQILEWPMPKQVVVVLLRLSLELQSACLRVLACLLCCSCSINVGTFWVTRPACCRACEWCR